MMGTTPPMFWVRVSQCLSTDLCYTCLSADLFAYTGQNTLPVNKMTAIIRMKGIRNQIKSSTKQINNKSICNYDGYDSAKSGYGSSKLGTGLNGYGLSVWASYIF